MNSNNQQSFTDYLMSIKINHSKNSQYPTKYGSKNFRYGTKNGSVSSYLRRHQSQSKAGKHMSKYL